MTSGQKGKLSVGELRSHEAEYGKALPSMELEGSLEWLPRLEYSVAYNMGESMVAQIAKHGSGRCLCREEESSLGFRWLGQLSLLSMAVAASHLVVRREVSKAWWSLVSRVCGIQ